MLNIPFYHGDPENTEIQKRKALCALCGENTIFYNKAIHLNNLRNYTEYVKHGTKCQLNFVAGGT